MNITLNPGLRQEIQKAQELGIPFIWHMSNHDHTNDAFVQCFALEQLNRRVLLKPIDFTHDLIIPLQYITPLPKALLEDPSSHPSPLNSDVTFTSADVIIRSTFTFDPSEYQKHIDQQCIAIEPGRSEPCDACVNRVHTLAILSGYLSNQGFKNQAQVTEHCYLQLLAKWPQPSGSPYPCSPRVSSSCSQGSRPGTPFVPSKA